MGICNPGRCPGLLYCAPSGLSEDFQTASEKAMISPLTLAFHARKQNFHAFCWEFRALSENVRAQSLDFQAIFLGTPSFFLETPSFFLGIPSSEPSTSEIFSRKSELFFSEVGDIF
jgi:hypothetical protein